MMRSGISWSLIGLTAMTVLLLLHPALVAADSAANPSYSTTSGDTIRDHDFGVFKLGATGASYNFDVYNLPAPSGTTSNMTLSNVLPFGDSGAMSLSGTVNGLTPGAHVPMQLVLATNQRGRLGVTYRLDFTSDSIQNSPVSSLVLTGHAIVSPPGDYDSDGDVDSTDYGIWRSHFGANYAPADGNLDGVVDSADFVVWRKNYSGPLGTGDSLDSFAQSSHAAIPEPAAVVLAVLGAAALCFASFTRRHPADRFPRSTR